MKSRSPAPLIALALGACGHYSFESASTRGDGGDAGDAGGARDAEDASDSLDADATLGDGLQVWLECEMISGDVVFDSSGFNSTARCLAGKCPTIITNGPRGNAFLFDGQTDVVTVAPDIRFQLATFTAAVWLRLDNPPTNANTFQAAWLKHSTDYVSDEVWGIYNQEQSAVADNLIAGASYNGVNAYANLGPTIVGTWTHVAVSFDGASYRAYRDGMVTETTTVATPPPDPMTELVLGAEFTVNDRLSFWNGALDDARLYNRVLSDAEIAELALP